MRAAVPGGSRYRLTFAVLATGVLAYSVLQTIVFPVLPLLRTSLDTDPSTLSWVVTAYLVSAAVGTPIFGRFGDKVGKKRVLVIVLGVLACGSVIAAMATSIELLIIGRAIQGLGAGVVPLSFGIIRDEFPPGRVGGAVGVVAALLALGGGVALVLAGPIVSLLSYHWLFWIPAILTAASGVATHFLIPESPVRKPGRVNWSAALLLSTWLIAILLGVSQAPTWGWGSPVVLGLLAVGVLLIPVWILVELRAKTPLIDMRMMRIPTVWTTNVVAFMLGITIFTTSALVPAFAETATFAGYGFGASVTQAGLLLAPNAVAMIIFGSLSGWFAHLFGTKTVLLIGSVACIPAMVFLAAAHSEPWQVSTAMALYGVGVGLSFSAMSTIIVDSVPQDQTGAASGMTSNIRTLGGSIGTAAMTAILASAVSDGSPPTEAGYTAAFAILAVVAVIGAVGCLFIPGRPGRAGGRRARHQDTALVGADRREASGECVPTPGEWGSCRP